MAQNSVLPPNLLTRADGAFPARAIIEKCELIVTENAIADKNRFFNLNISESRSRTRLCDFSRVSLER